MPPRRLDLGYVGPDGGITATTVDALRDRDFHVAIGHSIQDAEEFAEERSIDCLVVDHRDSIDAIDVLESVATIDEFLPVVVYPIEGGEDLAAGCVALDVEGYVPRDDGIETLVDVLDDVRPAGDPRRDAEGMLDALLNLVPRSLAIYFKDTAGRHVAMSREFTGLIGPPYFETPDGLILHDAEEVLGRTDFALYSTSIAKKTVEDEAWIMRTGEPIVDEIEHHLEADGSEVFAATSKAPWYDSAGQLRGIVGVTADVTEPEQHRRQLQRKNDRLERFANVLSHDLRNPLAIAEGRVAELEGDPGAEEDVTWALERMDELITDVLELACQGAVVDDPESISLDVPAREAWATVEGGGALELGDLPTVSGDRERLRACFENLFRNSIEHGGQDVTVRAESHPEGVTVTDDGPGIPEDEREQIFEHGYSTGEDGTGFGLSIVREIAEAHGWEIRALDHDGGARFLLVRC